MANCICLHVHLFQTAGGLAQALRTTPVTRSSLPCHMAWLASSGHQLLLSPPPPTWFPPLLSFLTVCSLSYFPSLTWTAPSHGDLSSLPWPQVISSQIPSSPGICPDHPFRASVLWPPRWVTTVTNPPCINLGAEIEQERAWRLSWTCQSGKAVWR